LPLVISNLAKKPGAVTLLELHVKKVDDNKETEFVWGLFWKESPSGARTPERRPSPIAIPGFTSVERNVQFDSLESIEWKPCLYELKLHVRVGRKRSKKEVSKFYLQLSDDHCSKWYRKPFSKGPWVDDIPTYRDSDKVPASGT
jgi:hypothetical protein